MNFEAQDPSNVKSLLAFLRTSQEAAQAGVTASQPATTAAAAPSPSPAPLTAQAPSAKSLTELLAALSKKPQSEIAQFNSQLAGPEHNEKRQDGAAIAAALLQQHADPAETSQPTYEPFKPFGPIASQSSAPRRPLAPPSSTEERSPVSFNARKQDPESHPTQPRISTPAVPYQPVPSPVPSSSSSLVDRARAAAAQTPRGSALKRHYTDEEATEGHNKAKGKARASKEDMRSWSFAKALPVLSGLLEDESFVRQVKAMKAEQDALERKLWAQQEKIQSAHLKKADQERTMASLARRPWTEEQEKANKAALNALLGPFHKLQVLPALDALSARHHSKLEDLGVPGLGPPLAGSGGWGAVSVESDKETRQRVNKLMAVLEGVISDHEE